MNTFPYAPNKPLAKPAPGVAGAWYVVASDGSTYTSVSAMTTAGKKAWPNLDPGMFLQGFSIASEATAGGPGSAFYVAVNPQSTPTTKSNGKQVLAGEDYTYTGVVWQVWIWLETSTDILDIQGAH